MEKLLTLLEKDATLTPGELALMLSKEEGDIKEMIKKLEDDGHQSFVFTCRAREAAIGAEISKSTVVFKLSRNDDAVR